VAPAASPAMAMGRMRRSRRQLQGATGLALAGAAAIALIARPPVAALPPAGWMGAPSASLVRLQWPLPVARPGRSSGRACRASRRCLAEKTLDELKGMCRARSLKVAGSKADVVARLQEAMEADAAPAMEATLGARAEEVEPEPLPGEAAPWMGEDFGDDTVSFGKYSGSPFEEVLQLDPSYCQWVVSAAQDEQASSGVELFAAYIGKHAPDLLEPPTTVGFGKYKGRTFEEVLELDPGYCMWVRQAVEDPESDSGPALRALADFVRERQQDMVVSFGKHVGKSFSQVAEEDPEYCDWVLERALEEDRSGGAFSSFVQFLREYRGLG